jgi:hypothetical protein
MLFYFSKDIQKIIFKIRKEIIHIHKIYKAVSKTHEKSFAKFVKINCRYGRRSLRKLLMLFHSQELTSMKGDGVRGLKHAAQCDAYLPQN